MMKTAVLLTIVLGASMLAIGQERAPDPPPMPDSPPGMGGAPHMGMHGPGGGMRGGRFGAWWKDSELAKELNLTDQQKQQLEQTFTDYRLKLIDLRADVERQETKLEPLMHSDQINEAQVSSQLDALIAARGRLEKTTTMMFVAMRKVLTPQQWKMLEQKRSEHHMQRFRMRGPDGPRDERAPRPDNDAAQPPKGPGGLE